MKLPRGLAVLVLLLLGARPVLGRVLMTQKDALALAFPAGVKVDRRTAYLDAEQLKAAEADGRVKIGSKVWSYYVGTSSAGVLGYAYFDTHVVRTMPETFMAVLEPGGAVRFVELLSFQEPDDYLPSERWLKQFQGKELKDDLLVHRAIRNMTGASLTSETLSSGVRRILAVHAVLHPKIRILTSR
ncbi:MAG: FMN-binding protein [Elusimicrobiota bacterium]